MVIIALQITISVLEEDSFEEIEVAEFLRENCSCDDEARDIVTTYTSVDTIRDVFRNKSTEHCPYGNFLSNETESMELVSLHAVFKCLWFHLQDCYNGGIVRPRLSAHLCSGGN